MLREIEAADLILFSDAQPKKAVHKFKEKVTDDAGVDNRHSHSNALDTQLSRISRQLDAFDGRMRVLDPGNVIKRGYALLSDSNRRTITSLEQVQLNDNINIRLKDGELGVEVLKKNQDKKD